MARAETDRGPRCGGFIYGGPVRIEAYEMGVPLLTDVQDAAP